MSKIFYLCDGEVESCRKCTCYKTRPDYEYRCEYTSDINHAINFKKSQGFGRNFYEKPPANDVADGN